MAANRQNVPIRQEAGDLNIDDGTMCRMPSPRPGPLRSESAADLYSSSSGFAGDRVRSRNSGSEVEKRPAPFAVGNAA